jgi:hypothetical protein|tara:strand:- start:2679 stop:3659 length:981 start_codon:yes stop_codon:yes gene_type:complete
MINIALIGCGKIGSRHLQSLVKLNYKTNIYLVDPKSESINVSLNLIENELEQNSKISIKPCSKLDEIPTGLDFAIIASDSKPRFEIFKSLMKTKAPKRLILEKLLFSKEEEFSEALKLYKKEDVKIWVNQWMSAEPSFRDLCNFFNQDERIEISISGDNWGLCCNSVHYLELFDFLCHKRDLKIQKYDFEKVIFSKRKGYLELNGKIIVSSSNGSKLFLTSNDAGKLEGEEILILITTPNAKAKCVFKMDSLDCKLEVNDKKINRKYDLFLQSNFTHRIIEEILETGSCKLPYLDRAIYHHELFYPLFRNFFMEKGIDLSEGIPIT